MSREKLEPFVDVEAAVLWWGEVKCNESARSRKQKTLKNKHFVKNENVLDVQIDWSHLKSFHRTQWPEDDTRQQGRGRVNGGSDADNKKSARATDVTKSEGQSSRPADILNSDVNILFETDFHNTTTVEQTCTLNINKTTNSSCTTEIENGVTKGFELSATLAIGDFLEIGAGFSREVSLTKTEGETIEKSVSWSAESNLTVPRGRRATARMQVIEQQKSGDFTVFTTMAGHVVVKYISFKDDSLVFIHSGKIDSIIRKYQKEMKIQGKKFAGIEYPGDAQVEFQTKGNCKFRYGIKQVVTISLDPSDGAK